MLATTARASTCESASALPYALELALTDSWSPYREETVEGSDQQRIADLEGKICTPCSALVAFARSATD